MAWRPVVLWIFATPALAAPVVIFDAGNTKPIAPYLESVTVKRPPASRASPELSVPKHPQGGFDKRLLLPIRTPEMTSGRLDENPLNPELRERLAPLTRPVFLIGADAQSLNWLARHRKQLKALGAVGMVVHVDTPEALTAVEQAGKGLVIVPASGSLLAQFLGLCHYPVLISRHGIEQ